MRSLNLAVAAALSVLAFGTAWAEPMEARLWASFSAPSMGRPSSIGGAAAGCLTGAVALDLQAPGLQVLRPQRNRFWAHPRTVDYVQELGESAQRAGIGPILVGDMSQPRGGPMAFGHGSHQHGLDVDIWFRLPGKTLKTAELADPKPLSMVRGTKTEPRNWTQAQETLLRLAAQSPQIDRIFVNPAIKAQMCRSAKGEPAWLGKLRPWWGHDEHFHARLKCTPGDLSCMPQKPAPEGTGCGAEVQSWNAKPKLLPETAKDKPNTRRPDLPEACKQVLGMPAMNAAMPR